MVIDYSKWDNIDTDSEPDEHLPPKPIQPLRPKVNQPLPSSPTSPSFAPAVLSNTSTTATPHPATPKAASSATTLQSDQPPSHIIPAVLLRCNGDRSPTGSKKWTATAVPSDHPIFTRAPAPLPALLGIPLVFSRTDESTWWATRPGQPKRFDHYDNQVATYLNIAPETCYAPAAWQAAARVGTVLVARRDKKPLLEQHVEALWMFCDKAIDLYDFNGVPPRHIYNKEGFARWWEHYQAETGGYRSDFANIKSPFEV